MKTISKSENIGNTFVGLVMAAFGLDDQRKIKIDYSLQFSSCGTIEVLGASYDWFDRGDSVSFSKSI